MQKEMGLLWHSKESLYCFSFKGIQGQKIKETGKTGVYVGIVRSGTEHWDEGAGVEQRGGTNGVQEINIKQQKIPGANLFALCNNKGYGLEVGPPGACSRVSLGQLSGPHS